MLTMAKEQLTAAQQSLPDIEEKLKVALIPKDPNDDKNIFLEIRPGAGGDEA
jgi:peptide chain release factor 1